MLWVLGHHGLTNEGNIMTTITGTTYQAAIEIEGGAIKMTIIRDVTAGICAPIKSITLEPVSNEIMHVMLEAERALIDAGYFTNSAWTLHTNGIFADIIKFN